MELPKRKQNRLQGYDYSTPNAYFITICTKDKLNVFWSDVGAIIDRPENVPLTSCGRIVDRSIRNIPKYYPGVCVDHYVIMPNHIHMLIQICSDENGRSMIVPTISTVIRLLKGDVTKQFGCPIWQKGFYDHVIRNETDYQNVWQYIEGNPGKCMEDKLFIPLSGDQ